MAAKRAAKRRPRQARSLETVRAILDAAERLLAEAPPSELRMSHVAKLAGVGVGSLYEYFGTKDDVLRAVEQRSWIAESAALHDAIDTFGTLPTDEAVVRTVELAISLMVRRARLHGVSITQDPLELAQRRELLETISLAVQARLEGTPLRTKNRTLAVRLVVKTTAAMTLLGLRDHPELFESGEYPRELALMVARYLVPTSIDEG